MKHIKLAFAAVTLTVSSVSAAAPLTLDAARAEARSHAPEGAALDARIRGATVVLDDANRVFRRDPSLDVSYTTGALTGSPDEQVATVGLALPIDISGSRTPREGAARADRDRALYEREDGLRALDEAVAVAFADTGAAQRSILRADRALSLYDLSLDAERQRLRSGVGNQLDLDAAALDAAAARSRQAQARGELARARVRLGRVLGRGRSTELVVEDPPEHLEVPSEADLATAVERDPRVLAAEANRRARSLAVEVYERLAIPAPTVGLGVEWRQRDVPARAFRGPSPPGLSAVWSEWELGASVRIPLTFFEYREPRARALELSYDASAHVATVRAEVRAEFEESWSAYRAAAEAYGALVTTREVIDRDFDLVEQSVRAGTLDALARAVALRRLEDAGRRLDLVIRDLRAARARWERRVLGRRTSGAESPPSATRAGSR